MKKTLQEGILKTHKELHDKSHDRGNRYGNCINCFPTTTKEKNFAYFWKRVEKLLEGLIYTGFTQITFKYIQEEREKEEPNEETLGKYLIELQRSIIYKGDKRKSEEEELRILTTIIKEGIKPVISGDFGDFELTLTPKIKPFASTELPPLFKIETDEDTEEEMDEELTRNLTQAMKEMGEKSIVTPTLFYGKEEEDPTEWIRNFNRAALANRWNEVRKLQIVGSYLRGNA